MSLKSEIVEVLYKPYSLDVKGYIIRIADLIYIVINSNLSKADADKAQDTLIEAAASAPEGSLVLLQGNGELYKTDNLEFLERAC